MERVTIVLICNEKDRIENGNIGCKGIQTDSKSSSRAHKEPTTGSLCYFSSAAVIAISPYLRGCAWRLRLGILLDAPYTM